MTCGVISDRGVIPIPNYWPNSVLVKMNDAIWGLEVKYRNFFVAYYVLGIKSHERIAEHCQTDRTTIWRWFKDPKSKPYKALLEICNN